MKKEKVNEIRNIVSRTIDMNFNTKMEIDFLFEKGLINRETKEHIQEKIEYVYDYLDMIKDIIDLQ